MSRAIGSNLVAAGIFLSRIAGLIRNMMIGVVLGGQPAVTDALNFAMRLPNLLQNLLGEGALSASFIPVYAKLVEEKRDREADDLAGVVVTLLALVTAVIVLAAVLLARPLVWLFTDWEADPAKYELTITLTRVTTVGIGFLVISAWCLGILNSHRSFFLSYVAPVVWNVAQIAVLVLFGLLNWRLEDIAVAVAWAVVAGGLLQLLIQMPRVRRLAPTVRPNLVRTAASRDVLRRFAPAIGARGVVQLSSYVDLVLATIFLVTGALTWYSFSLPLYLLPISLFGFSVAAAELAEMSRRSDNLEVVSARLQPALRRVLIPAGFITAAYLAASPTFVDALYGWPSRLFGKEGLQDPTKITTIALVVTAFAVGLPATMTARVTQNTLYSLGDVKGPAKIAVVRVVISALAGLVLILQLDWLTFSDGQIVAFGDFPHWPPWERVPTARRVSDAIPHLGAVGLGLGASLSAWVEWGLLRRLLRRRLQAPIRSGWARPVTVAAVAAGVWMFATAGLHLPSPIDALAAGTTGLLVYAGGLWLQGIRPTRPPRQGLASSP
ncbi:MAG: murein biosynthesis integral membrane protein MurJ [Acidimicrobiales bacterium]